MLDDEKKVKMILDWGQLVWNKAVADDFPEHENSKELLTLLPLFLTTIQDKTFVTKFLDRKRRLFGDQNFFIIKQTSFLNTTGALAISVAVLPTG